MDSKTSIVIGILGAAYFALLIAGTIGMLAR